GLVVSGPPGGRLPLGPGGGLPGADPRGRPLPRGRVRGLDRPAPPRGYPLGLVAGGLGRGRGRHAPLARLPAEDTGGTGGGWGGMGPPVRGALLLLLGPRPAGDQPELQPRLRLPRLPHLPAPRGTPDLSHRAAPRRAAGGRRRRPGAWPGRAAPPRPGNARRLADGRRR